MLKIEKVAFIISTYNNDSLKLFKKSIESIVNQSYGFENINIYLGIDGDIEEGIHNYIHTHKHLFYKIITNETNNGLAYTLNALIGSLECEQFVFRMDADDLCRSDRVDKTIQKFQNEKELMLVGSDILEIDASGRPLSYKKMPSSTKEIVRYSISRNPFNHPTVCVRRKFFDLVGTYDKRLGKSQDYDLWARALMKGISCSNINEPLVYFRQDEQFVARRNLPENILIELKISLRLMRFFGKYSQLPIILSKSLIRLLPSRAGIFFYRLTRERRKISIVS